METINAHLFCFKHTREVTEQINISEKYSFAVTNLYQITVIRSTANLIFLTMIKFPLNIHSLP